MRIVLCALAMPATSVVSSSPKRSANLSLSADVLDAAKALRINVSQVCDRHLREVVRQEQARRWQQEHADFVVAYNATLQAEGLSLAEFSTF